MPEKPLHQPHDKLFRATFSNPANAAAFLRHHLQPPLSTLVDWNSLVLESGSFIDQHMAGSEADLLFSAKLGGANTLLYILWEHQHREDPLIGLRLLSYMVRIWTRQAKTLSASAKLAPILPLVLAQNKDRWKTPNRFQDLFVFPEGPWEAVRACTPNFDFRLLQLVELPYEDIRGTPEGVLALRSLRAEPLGELLHALVWDSAIIHGVSREAVERFFRYVLHAEVDRTQFQAKVEQLESETFTNIAMTLADCFRQEGHKEGLREGERQTKRQALLSVLEARFGPIPAGLLERLSTVTDLDRLEELLKAAAVLPDLEAFVSGL